jgi:hypothetical protein
VSITANSYFYVVFWSTGAAAEYLTDDDTPINIPGYNPEQYAIRQLSTAWDNSGAGGSWESLGNYGMKLRIVYAATGADCNSSSPPF